MYALLKTTPERASPSSVGVRTTVIALVAGDVGAVLVAHQKENIGWHIEYSWENRVNGERETYPSSALAQSCNGYCPPCLQLSFGNGSLCSANTKR